MIVITIKKLKFLVHSLTIKKLHNKSKKDFDFQI
jgi:hypothetical protein